MTRILFRADNTMIAEYKRKGHTYDSYAHIRSWATREMWDETPAADVGHTWRVRWALTLDQRATGLTEGPIAGYAICCIKCGEVHRWCSALNCASKTPVTSTWVDDAGVTHTSTYSRCDHTGVGSCWVWSGIAEEGTLTAAPSLWSVVAEGGCGYHGFLRNGDIT